VRDNDRKTQNQSTNTDTLLKMAQSSGRIDGDPGLTSQGNPAQFSCPKCPRIFGSRRGLLQHLRVCATRGGTGPANQGSPIAGFGCTKCVRTFGSKRGLSQHQRVCDPAAYNAGKGSRPARRKYCRWEIDETRYLALTAAENPDLSRQEVAEVGAGAFAQVGVQRSINQVLSHMRTPTYLGILEEEKESFLRQEVNYGVTPAKDRPALERRELFKRCLDKACRSHKGDAIHLELNGIILRALSGEDVEDGLNALLEKLTRPRPKRRCIITRKPCGKSRKKYKSSFADIQHRFKRDKGKVARQVLDGEPEGRPESIPNFLDSWEETFRAKDGVDVSNMRPVGGLTVATWDPIYMDEISEALRTMDSKSAGGPDGLSVADLKELPRAFVWKLVNLILLTGKAPVSLKRSTTIFIPKGDQQKTWRDFRPITLTPVLLRVVHKILAKRISREADLDTKQRGFLPYDACVENVLILDAVLKTAHQESRNLNVALIDIANAFPSVSHLALIRALECANAPKGLIEYVLSLYTDFFTVLCTNEERTVRIGAGVIQGDPLSAILFILVLDQALRLLPDFGFQLASHDPTIGRVSSANVNGQCLADDTNLLSGSCLGLQLEMDSFNSNVETWSLLTHKKKTRCISLVADTKRKVVHVDTKRVFKLGNDPVETIGPGERFRYLGAFFTPFGVCSPPETLPELLRRVEKSLLKPQQKFYIVRTHLIPRLVHQFSLCKLSIKKLDDADLLIRKSVRSFLHLPAHLENSFFYGPVRSGGLGLLSFRASVPSMVFRRFTKPVNSEVEVIRLAASSDHNASRLKKAYGAMPKLFIGTRDVDEWLVGTDSRITRQILAEEMYRDFAGRALRGADQVSYVHSWISNGSTEINSKLFVNMLKIRFDCMPSRSHDYTGGLRSCRFGCLNSGGRPAIETNHHVLQKCKAVKGLRTVRHDNVLSQLCEYLMSDGYYVVRTPTIQNETSRKFPDVICCKDGSSVHVVDVQIVGGNLETKHQVKIDKYRKVEKSVRRFTRREFSHVRISKKAKTVGDAISYTSLTFSHRGLLSRDSERDLRKMGVSKQQLRRLAITSLKGSVILFWTFLSRTLNDV